MSRRMMIYPYTLTSKIVQFPYKFYYDNVPHYKAFIWAFIGCMPIFFKIQSLVCSEANYIRLEEYRKKEREEWERHKEHLL